MLLSVLRNSYLSGGEKLFYVLVIAFCVLLSLSVHELCHGWAAYFMGDKTAKYSGRLSLNPIAHLDPIGALCLFVFGFGWAKPVPVNPWNFNNKKGGMVLTSLAGPISNFILAFFAYIGVIALGGTGLGMTTSVGSWFAQTGYMICYFLVSLNLGLGLFNLIPIPPLDGSKVLTAILPANLYFKLMEYERYGFIILIILINLPIFDRIFALCQSGIISLYGLIIGLFI